MSRQDKATTERHAKILRELLKRPENKVCADCKRNDPRWASWNIGVFLCIRCSGIHRSMGTHISRVKSVDLDVWTPEQMASIQKWGNRLANLYWEAHLKPGHIPSDHKMESFIRSKYESRRWAKEGPPPSDPSTLDSQVPQTPASSAQPTAPAQPPQRASMPAESLVTVSASRPSATSRQPQSHQLLSASVANRAQQPVAQAATTQASQPTQPQASAATASTNELFSLDFTAPAPSATPSNSSTPAAPKKDVKQDILSLFSTPSAAPTAATAMGGFGQFAQVQNTWNNFDAQPAQQPVQPVSMAGATGVGMWGASSGWNATPVAPAQSNIWGTPAAQPAVSQQQSLFNTSDVWSSSGTTTGAGGSLFGSSLTSGTQKKDDAFGDIWGGFK
ncbi:ArfGap-domain-containing protein [Wolfiporia cocos MD-104 SS10]|uniref:ArfGap-domain-containing protein n=1 Tax=Wolfiporia cocos (strain MD-104) TaxID=742152 RepID=A0A2H3J681_WOLCO|nr:ArfGap-domain-containing protein [Wolfiporia cocos MD-104 SS10]